MSVAAGDRLGPYEILSRIGEGGMGEVWRAKDTRLNRIVAIKLLRGEQTNQPDSTRVSNVKRRPFQVSTIRTSAQSTTSAQRTVSSFSCWNTWTERPWPARLRRGAMRIEEFLRCALDVLAALSQAHRQGVVHRDLKPSNVMLTKSGAKVLDFGVASAVRFAPGQDAETLTKTLTSEGMIMGTYQYMSPEQLQGREVDARSDIFSFGAVLYEMASGQRAFQGESTASIIAGVLDRQPAPVSQLQPDLPRWLDWIVQTCLEKNPEERWQSAHDVRLHLWHLRDLQSDRASVAHPATKASILGRLQPPGWPGWHWVEFWPAHGSSLHVSRSCDTDVMRFEIAAPPHSSFAVSSNASVPVIDFSVSPDGSKIAFVADQNEIPFVWVRSMSEPAAKPLTGTEGGQNPFWSPDGTLHRFLRAQNSLKKGRCEWPQSSGSACACSPSTLAVEPGSPLE